MSPDQITEYEPSYIFPLSDYSILIFHSNVPKSSYRTKNRFSRTQKYIYICVCVCFLIYLSKMKNCSRTNLFKDDLKNRGSKHTDIDSDTKMDRLNHR